MTVEDIISRFGKSGQLLELDYAREIHFIRINILMKKISTWLIETLQLQKSENLNLREIKKKNKTTSENKVAQNFLSSIYFFLKRSDFYEFTSRANLVGKELFCSRVSPSI